MRSSQWLCAPAAAILVLLASCGGHTTSSSAPPPPSFSTAALVGSWRLFGVYGAATGSSFWMSMGVVGTQIHGQATYGVTCSNATSEGGFDVAMDGEIATDGSFEMKNAAADDIQFVIQGNAPLAGATAWSGSYTFSSHSGSICTIQETGNFNATQLPVVTGTYSGTVSDLPEGETTPFTISTTLTQGSFTSTSFLAGTPYYYTPVSATLTTDGASCFASATIEGPLLLEPAGQVMGNMVQLTYTTDTGATMSTEGFFTDDTQKTMIFEGTVIGGSCNQQFYGTLTRQ